MSRKSVRIPRDDGFTARVWALPRTRVELPRKSSHRRTYYPPVVDQGSAGLCDWNAFAGHAYAARNVLGAPNLGPISRIYTGYFGALIEAQVRPDHRMQEGVAVRSLMESGRAFGLAKETDVPYNVSREFVQPTPVQNFEAFHHQVASYVSLSEGRDPTGQWYDLDVFKRAIEFGTTFMFIIVYWNKLKTRDFMLLPPDPGDPVNVGMDSHALCAVDYDDDARVFWCRNSWGDKWNDGTGHLGVPYYLMREPMYTYSHKMITGFLELDRATGHATVFGTV